MARSSKPRRTQSSRKPVTIDLEAKEVDVTSDVASAADAEPVAFDSMGESGKSPHKPAEIDSSHADKQSDDDLSAATAVPPPAKNGPMSGVANGVIGGVVALLGGAILQWGGVLPSFGPAPEPVEQVDISPLQGEIDSLKLQLTELGENTGSTELTVPQSLTNEISAALQASDEALSSVSTVEQTLVEVNSSVAELQSVVSSGGAGENAGLEALSQRLDGIDGQLAGIESNASTVDTGALAELASEMAATGEKIGTVEAEISANSERLASTENVVNDQLAALTERLAKLEESASSGTDSTRVAAAIAAAGLKSAVDRGGSFMTELEAFATVSSNDEIVTELREYAASGVPTVNQLSEEFPSVANRIVATGSGLAEDASVADRLMASARSLVQVRPVGEVDGDTPGAIAARVEGRLQGGDLAAALAEWEALPDAAKEANSGFSDRMRARRTVDSMVSKALTGAMAATGTSTN